MTQHNTKLLKSLFAHPLKFSVGRVSNETKNLGNDVSTRLENFMETPKLVSFIVRG